MRGFFHRWRHNEWVRWAVQGEWKTLYIARSYMALTCSEDTQPSAFPYPYRWERSNETLIVSMRSKYHIKGVPPKNNERQ
jgi:hypothetical protein